MYVYIYIYVYINLHIYQHAHILITFLWFIQVFSDFLCLQLKPLHSLSFELPASAFNVDNRVFHLDAEVLGGEGVLLCLKAEGSARVERL